MQNNSLNNHFKVNKQPNFVLFSTYSRTFSQIDLSHKMHFLKPPECRKKSGIWVPIMTPLLHIWPSPSHGWGKSTFLQITCQFPSPFATTFQTLAMLEPTSISVMPTGSTSKSRVFLLKRHVPLAKSPSEKPCWPLKSTTSLQAIGKISHSAQSRPQGSHG